jgi:hypothetical protein
MISWLNKVEIVANFDTINGTIADDKTVVIIPKSFWYFISVVWVYYRISWVPEVFRIRVVESIARFFVLFIECLYTFSLKPKQNWNLKVIFIHLIEKRWTKFNVNTSNACWLVKWSRTFAEIVRNGRTEISIFIELLNGIFLIIFIIAFKEIAWLHQT